MPAVVIYGAGDNGREVGETLLAAQDNGGGWELVGFLDDGPDKQGARVLGLPVLGTAEWIADHRQVQVVMGIGHPRWRRSAAARVEALGGRWATVVHPCAVVSPSAMIGEGCVIFAGVVLSSNSRLGRLVQANFNAVIHHDTEVGDLAALMANVALGGNVRVGEGTFVGMGSQVRQGVSVGEWSLVGCGASVVRDLPAYCVATGVPARPVRSYSTPQEMPPI